MFRFQNWQGGGWIKSQFKWIFLRVMWLGVGDWDCHKTPCDTDKDTHRESPLYIYSKMDIIRLYYCTWPHQHWIHQPTFSFRGYIVRILSNQTEKKDLSPLLLREVYFPTEQTEFEHRNHLPSIIPFQEVN